MIRQGLEADSAYVDVALHGDGLTSLQFREGKGERHPRSAGQRLGPASASHREARQIRDDGPGGRRQGAEFLGAAVRIAFQEPFYVGLGVCAHNKDVTESAVFSNVELAAPPAALERAAGFVQHSRDADDLVDGSSRRSRHDRRGSRRPTGCATVARSIYNSGGRIFRVPVGRRGSASHRYRLCHALQQRPRGLAGWNTAGDQRPVAGTAAVAHLYAADHGGNAGARHADWPVVLARLVAGRQDAGLLW